MKSWPERRRGTRSKCPENHSFSVSKFIHIFFFLFKRKSPKTPTSEKEKAGKKPRVWELGGNNKDLPVLDRSKDRPEDARSDFKTDNEVILLV